MLAVIQYQQEFATAKVVEQHLAYRSLRSLSDTDRRCDGLGHEVRVGNRREIDQPDAVRKLVRQVRRETQRQTRLAGAAGARERHQARRGQQLSQLAALVLPSNKARELGREVVPPRSRAAANRSWRRVAIRCESVIDVDARITDVANPGMRVLFQAALQQAHNRVWRRIWQPPPLGLMLEHSGQRVRRRLAVKGRLAGEHFEDDATECPDVGARVDRLAARLLWRHVGRRAEDDSRLSHRGGRDRRGVVGLGLEAWGLVERFGETKVQHLHRAVLTQLDVRGLEIAMDDALLVRRFERFGDLSCDPQRFVNGNRSSSDPFGEVLPLDDLHHQRQRGDAACRRLLEPVDLGDARMIEGRQHFGFALESGQPVAIAGHLRRQHLQRDVALQARVSGSVDLTHTPGAQWSDDFIGANSRAWNQGHLRHGC